MTHSLFIKPWIDSKQEDCNIGGGPIKHSCKSEVPCGLEPKSGNEAASMGPIQTNQKYYFFRI